MKSEELLSRKLARVEDLFEKYRLRLEGDKKLQKLLVSYLKAFAATESISQRVGLFVFCARCGQEGQGSCCGEDMEFHCEDVLLLANRVAGVIFPKERLFPKACFFLGKEGCLLRVRPLICRNFLCPEASSYLGLQKMRLIQEALGPEAEALFRLCEYLRRLCPEI